MRKKKSRAHGHSSGVGLVLSFVSLVPQRKKVALGGGFAPSRVEGASQVRRPHLCAHSPSSFEIAIKKGETDTEMYGQIEAAMLETCIHAVEKMGETNDWLLQPC